MSIEQDVSKYMEKVKEKDPGQKEFHQAVQEVVESMMPFVNKNPKYKQFKIDRKSVV